MIHHNSDTCNSVHIAIALIEYIIIWCSGWFIQVSNTNHVHFSDPHCSTLPFANRARPINSVSATFLARFCPLSIIPTGTTAIYTAPLKDQLKENGSKIFRRIIYNDYMLLACNKTLLMQFLCNSTAWQMFCMFTICQFTICQFAHAEY